MVEPKTPLAPCPFCGAGATSIRENGKVWLGTRYSEPSSVSVLHHCETVEGQPLRAIERVGRDRASALAAWNRRAAPHTSRKQVAWWCSHPEIKPDGHLWRRQPSAEYVADGWTYQPVFIELPDTTSEPGCAALAAL